MLNKDLFLNEKLFDVDCEKDATRSGYGNGLLELGEQDPNVVALCADLTESTKADKFAQKFPDRFFQVGVAEQNMAAIAAGLGVSGKTVFISSYAVFSPGKNWETVRTTIVYNQSNVKIAGHHSGIMTGADGATHQATEDIASVRAWPLIKIINPCDSLQGKLATIAAGKEKGAFYLRFSRDKTPIMTTDKTPFEIGKAQTYWVSDKPQAVIFATGYMVYYALVAARDLEKEGIPVLVTNIHTIKPLDAETVINQAKQTRAVVSVEDHQVAGGMGSAVCELLSKNYPTPQEFIGLQDKFGESGKPDELIEKYGMGAKSIMDATKKVISRKKS